MLLGFSTGAIFRQVPSVSKEIIDICREIGCNVIELSVMTLEEAELLRSLVSLGDNLSDFKYVSMHSPLANVTYKNDSETKKLLEKLEKAYKYLIASI